jgi:hypothetical protein
MRYLIYGVTVPTPTKDDSMGRAINAACELIRGGTAVLKIEGSDGFLMESSNIAFECLRRTKDRR